MGPHNGREQMKQLDKAEDDFGAMLCPIIFKNDRTVLVPSCAHVLVPSACENESESDQELRDSEALAAETSRANEARHGSTNTTQQLVDDADLVLLKAADKDEDDTTMRGKVR